VFLLIFVALGFLLPHMGEFVYPFGSRFSDLLISHYPNLEFVKTSIRNYHQIPLWSDTILSGYPFVANPLAGIWYLPTWFAVITPLPLGINLLVFLHLIFGGVGIYLFLKNQGLEFWVAALGGLSFALMPKLFSHYAAGHITLVFAVCWTPWLLFAESNRGVGKSWLKSVMPGIILGEIFLADPRWTIYAGGLWFLFAIKQRFEGEDIARIFGKYSKSVSVSNQGMPWFLGIGLQAVVALWIASPLLLPLYQFSKLSTRVLMNPEDNLTLSLDFFRLFGLAIPDMAGYAEFMIYPGSVLLVALIWTLMHQKARTNNWFWITMFLLSVLYSLGENIPFMPFLASLPGMRLLRVPSRALFLAGFSLSNILANVVHLLMQQRKNHVDNEPLANVFLVGLAGFMIVLAAGIWILSDEIPVEFVWGAFAILSSVLLVMLYEKKKITDWMAVCGFVVVICLDMGGVNISQMTFRSKSEISSENDQLIKALPQETGPYRIYSPSYSVPQQTAALNGLELADGIDPLQLSTYVTFMEDATGVPMKSYSVTLPPFLTGKPEEDNQFYKPDIKKLGLLNVKYIAAGYPIIEDDLILLERFGETWLYENSEAFPRAWIQEANSGQAPQNVQPVEIVEMTPNRISIKAEGPGRLVLSEIDYPGWKVRVDGENRDLEAYLGLLRAVTLDSGEHKVVFEFKPLIVYLGVAIKILTALMVLIFARRDRNAV